MFLFKMGFNFDSNNIIFVKKRIQKFVHSIKKFFIYLAVDIAPYRIQICTHKKCHFDTRSRFLKRSGEKKILTVASSKAIFRPDDTGLLDGGTAARWRSMFRQSNRSIREKMRRTVALAYVLRTYANGAYKF